MDTGSSERQSEPGLQSPSQGSAGVSTPGRWRISRIASTSLLVLALLLFLTPWADIKCAGETVETVTGLDMLAGSDYESSSGLYGETETHDEDPEVLVILSLVAGLAGIALFFLRNKIGAVGRGVMGVLGVVFLLGLVIKINSDIPDDAEGMIKVEYLPGFYLTFLCFLWAAIASLLPFWNSVFERHDHLEPSGEAGLPAPRVCPAQATGEPRAGPIEDQSSTRTEVKARLCSNCGSAIRGNTKTCAYCGAEET